MIKNVIFDVGGVLFDDSLKDVKGLLKKDHKEMFHKVFGKGFDRCLLGDMTVEEFKESLKDDPDYDDISFLLDKDKLHLTYPIIKENFKYAIKLKRAGYKIFLLTNISDTSEEYIKNTMNADKVFDGAIYSCEEHLIKPDPKIYELIVERYKLKKEETIFFDDREKNIIAANKFGIKGYVFKSVEDIKNALSIEELGE